MKRVVVHIDRLVLRGIDSADAHAVRAGVQAELQRLLANPHVARALVDGGPRGRVQAAMPVGADAGGGRSLGRAVAGAVARGIGGDRDTGASR